MIGHLVLKDQNSLRKMLSPKPEKKVFPLVMDYNPILPDIQKIIQKHAHLLSSLPELLEIFPSKLMFPAYRRTKNLKDILAPSKFCGDRGVDQAESETRGCFKCSFRCDLCKNFLIQDSKFKSFSTGRTYRINQSLSCSSKNVVYLASCNKCNLQYVGSTSTEFKVRFPITSRHAHKQKNVLACSPFQLYPARDF